MDEDKQVESNKIPGSEDAPIMEGSPLGVPTYSVDGIAQMAFSTHQTKVHLVEHFPQQEGLVGRHILNIVMANDQFLKIADAFHKLAEHMRDPLPEENKE